MLRIRIGSTVILGRPDDVQKRVEGLFVAKNGWVGWDDGGGEIRREAVPRPSSHGEFDLPVFQGSRVFSIDGHALAWSELELGHLRSVVNGIGATGDRVKVTVDHQGQTLWAMARRGAKPKFEDSGIRHGLHRAKFFLQFVAADPRKYGELRTFADGEAAFHYGNFPATPRYTVLGTAETGYTVTGPGGRQVVVQRPLAPSAPHVLDFATGGLYIGGSRVMGAITKYEPWSIPPGSEVTAVVNGSRTLRAELADTFI